MEGLKYTGTDPFYRLHPLVFVLFSFSPILSRLPFVTRWRHQDFFFSQTPGRSVSKRITGLAAQHPCDNRKFQGPKLLYGRLILLDLAYIMELQAVVP
ncbi:hypothetical protein PM082_017214 [Marasmius tenuissimus]|nr:hypothetical protein PM082_017214 [Marasmius tenuissimus]